MVKTALITGASSGIGREITRIHASKGGNVVIIAIDEEALNELKQSLEDEFAVEVKAIAIDLTEPDAPLMIYRNLKQAGIQVNYLINNAGFGGSGAFYLRKWKTDYAMIQLNIVALSALTWLFLPEFIQRNEGKILNVSSLASLMPGPYMAVYYASKAYVTSFGNALAEELKDTQVTVTTLLPGATATNFGRIAGIEKTPIFRKTASAQKVAKAGYHGMLKGRLNVLTGLTLTQKILTPMIPFTPKKVLLQIIHRLHNPKLFL